MLRGKIDWSLCAYVEECFKTDSSDNSPLKIMEPRKMGALLCISNKRSTNGRGGFMLLQMKSNNIVNNGFYASQQTNDGKSHACNYSDATN